ARTALLEFLTFFGSYVRRIPRQPMYAELSCAAPSAARRRVVLLRGDGIGGRLRPPRFFGGKLERSSRGSHWMVEMPHASSGGKEAGARSAGSFDRSITSNE